MVGEVWLLTEQGPLTASGAPLPGIPFGRRSVTAGAAAGDEIGLIVDGHEVWTRSEATWTRAAASKAELYSIVRSHHGRFLVGTERARLAWVAKGTLEYLPSFDRVPERRLWDTPYGAPPELRSLAVATDGALYANVHVGWIVRSTDGGATWASLRNGLDRDVHQVAVHPSDPRIVFAATAEGFHISHDRGDTFAQRIAGMPYVYQRAVACFPGRDVYLASTARDNRGAGARLDRTEDDGRTWTRVRGLPEAIHRNINTNQLAALPRGRGFAVVADTSLYETGDWGESWSLVARDLPPASALLVV